MSTTATRVKGASVTDRTDSPAGENELAALVGPFWSRDRTCSALGLTPEALAALQAEGGLLELRSAEGDPFYPLFQFQKAGNHVQVRTTVAAVTRVLRHFSAWAVAVLLHTPAPELDGSTPLEWLAAGGDAQDVVALARLVSKEWSAGSGEGSVQA